MHYRNLVLAIATEDQQGIGIGNAAPG